MLNRDEKEGGVPPEVEEQIIINIVIIQRPTPVVEAKLKKSETVSSRRRFISGSKAFRAS
ncbi:hypothetical protein EYF80_040513 [Liparis tanakae]|uniref:Uncharacterized protein n=1 Tax=Liparis tanakae TaxID=230148 RepID=A0A4Z2G6T8_9TELE|nr:hypothetical protein EYF80_040513 [Liparis tanakae]